MLMLGIILGRIIRVFGFIGIIFIILKLTGAIAWTWLAVFAFFWAPILIAFVIAFIVGACKAIYDSY